MKIVYSIANIGNSGGIERVLSTKVNYLVDELGYEVHIIVGGKKPENLFFHFSEKIFFHYLSIHFQKKKIWSYVFENKQDKEYRRKLTKKLYEISPDITISTFGQDASVLYKIKDGSVKVLEFHFTKNYLTHLGTSLKDDRCRFLRKYWLKCLQWRESYYAGKYNHVVLLTERDKQLWGGGDKFKVIPNPLSFASEEVALLENKIIVSMGRLVYPKGFDYLIRAFAILHKTNPEWKVFIYGKGQDKEMLQREIINLSLQDYFFLKEPEQDVKSIMLNSSLFVLPSLYDGFGLVLTEAMECGVPCLAFDCECGPSEIIKDGEDGFLVEVGNVVELAEKMKLLMEDKELRIRMGSAAKHNVQRYRIESIMQVWDDFFHELKGKK